MDAKDTHIKHLLVDMQSLAAKDSNSVLNTVALPCTPEVSTYCWTLCHSKNLKHNSTTCNNKADGHNDSATVTNHQGG
jgi:hypothetical protein